MAHVRPIRQSKKLQHVRYDVRGPILVEAQRLEGEGHKILKLNIGNTAPFGFEAPEAILADMIHHLPDSQGYSDSRGIWSARTAVMNYYQSHGLRDVRVDDVPDPKIAADEVLVRVHAAWALRRSRFCTIWGTRSWSPRAVTPTRITSASRSAAIRTICSDGSPVTTRA